MADLAHRDLLISHLMNYSIESDPSPTTVYLPAPSLRSLQNLVIPTEEDLAKMVEALEGQEDIHFGVSYDRAHE